MTRTEFKQVIKAFSLWRVDKGKGNYKLPNDERLSDYLGILAHKELDNHNLGINEKGNITDVLFRNGKWWLINPFDTDEEYDIDIQRKRVATLINEMLN